MAAIVAATMGIGTKLTQKPGGRGGGGTNLTWPDAKAGFFYVVVDSLLKSGFTADEIGKIGGGNFGRIFDKATAGHQ